MIERRVCTNGDFREVIIQRNNIELLAAGIPIKVIVLRIKKDDRYKPAL